MKITIGPNPDDPHFDTGLRWDSDVRWLGAVPKKKNKDMSQITTNISGLTVDQKITRGASIISQSTGNSLVPGNGPTLAAFSAEQSAYEASNTAVIAARDNYRQQLAARAAAEKSWTAKCNNLADFTQIATDGNAVAILSSGFGVRAPASPPQPVTAPVNLQVATNGLPGTSKLRWSPVTGAASYLVDCSPDPITNDSWVRVDTPTKARTAINGAEPGKTCWFRVAAVGPEGEGP